MITVYLCDDNQTLRTQCAGLIKQFAQNAGEMISIREFGSGDSLLFSLEDDPSEADIIYLDIVMPGINGINTAKKLRSYGCTSEIIFLTSNDEYVFESFDVSANHYILKNEFNPHKFEEIFLRAVANAKIKKTDFFTCKNGSKGKRIPIAEILYFEIKNRIVTVYYTSGTFDFYGNMGTLEKSFTGKHFIRIHRSYFVNISAIESMYSNCILLIDGTELPVGRTYYLNLQTAISKYMSTIL